jgi:HTH-type transcriptional regulator/antitoxin HigA
MNYQELLIYFPPRIINSEDELRATINIVNSLLDKESLSKDERDYLNLLGSLIYIYETEHVDIPDIWGYEFLNVLIEEHNTPVEDLINLFGSREIVDKLMIGELELDVEMIDKLSKYYKVNPLMFVKKS